MDDNLVIILPLLTIWFLPLRWCLGAVIFLTFLNIKIFNFDISTISIFMLFMRTFMMSIKYSWKYSFVKKYSLLFTWSIVSLAWTSDPVIGQSIVLTMLRILMILILVNYIVRDERDIKAFVYGGGAGIVFTLVSTFISLPGQQMIEAFDTHGRYSATGISYNTYAFQLVWVGSYIFFYVRQTCSSSFSLRLLHSVLFVFILWIPVAQSGSRAGLLCLLTVPVLFQLNLSVRRAMLIFTAAVLVVISGILSPAAIIPPNLPFSTIQTQERINVALAGSDETGRFEIWRTGLEIAYHHPVLGTGIGSSSQSYSLYYRNVWSDPNLQWGQGRVLHNSFITMLAELGIVGLALFLQFLSSWIRPAWAKSLEYRVLAAVFSFLILIAGTFHSFEQVTALMMTLAVVYRTYEIALHKAEKVQPSTKDVTLLGWPLPSAKQR